MNLVGGTLENLRHSLHLRGRTSTADHRGAHFANEPHHRLTRRSHGVAEHRVAELRDAFKEFIDEGPVLGQMRATRLGNGVDLLTAFLWCRDGEALPAATGAPVSVPVAQRPSRGLTARTSRRPS